MIIDLINSRCYIGSTGSCLYYRCNGHAVDLRKNRHANKFLQAAWNKYGGDNFFFLPFLDLTCRSEKCIRLLEQFYINTFKPEFNIQTVVKNYGKMKFSDEHRRKLSESNRRRKGKYHMSDEAKQRLSDAQNCLMSEDPSAYLEKKSRAGKAGKGKVLSDETRRKISEAHKRNWGCFSQSERSQMMVERMQSRKDRQ